MNAGQQTQLEHVKRALALKEEENQELQETIKDLMGHFQAEKIVQSTSEEMQRELAESTVCIGQKPKRKINPK